MKTLPTKTVVFRLSSIGDIVLASPMVRALRSAVGPKARIDFVVKKEFAELVRSNHHLSVVHEFDASKGFAELQKLGRVLRTEEYDLAVDIHNNPRTKYLRLLSAPKETVIINKRMWARWQLVHRKRNVYHSVVSVADRYLETLKPFGIEDDGKGLEIFLPDEIQFGISSKLAAMRLNKFNKVIGICPGAKHFTKRWQKEKFAQLGIQLAEKFRAKIFIFGGKGDKTDCAFVAASITSAYGDTTASDFSGEFSLLETAAALEFCDVVVTNDTGLMHLAAAKQRPVVAIFGSTVREFGFFPYGTKSAVVENHALDCRPCSHIGRTSCPKKHFKCMTDIQVKEVREAVERLI
ncbi:MAG: glycosyltransferase family 9 protein [Bacteroidota bacterium]|nr:glycosyltransferase family 9 protein [Bacteroidota bacterium]